MNNTTNDKEADEIAYWQSRPTHERMAAATELSAKAYGLVNIDELKMDKTLAIHMQR
jgi:hypothetical protein